MNSGGEQRPFINVRALRSYASPCFSALFYLTIAMIVLLLGGAVYYLYMGFIHTLPSDATSTHGWTQLFSMLFGLLLLLMSLIQTVILLALLRYRRFVYAPTLSHLPLLFAGIVSLLNAAVFLALAFSFFDAYYIVLVPAITFLALGIAWMICYGRSHHAETSDEREDERQQ